MNFKFVDAKWFLAFAIIILYILFQPVGFDFYYHIFYLQSIDYHFLYNKPHYIFGLRIDRYVLFPYIFYLFSFIKPLYIILILQVSAWVIPMRWVFNNILNVNSLTSLFLIIYFCVYWTPLTISIGFCCSYLLSKSRFSFVLLLISLLFHPISFLISFLCISFKLTYVSKKLQHLALMGIFFLLLIHFMNGDYFNPNSYDIKSFNDESAHSEVSSIKLEVLRPEVAQLVRPPINLLQNLPILFKKSKEIFLSLLLFLVLVKNIDLRLIIFKYFSFLIILASFAILGYKSFTNGSIIASFLYTEKQGRKYDSSFILTKSSYSSYVFEPALENISDSCFYSFPRFKLNTNFSSAMSYGLIKNCYSPSLVSYSIPLNSVLDCLKTLDKDEFSRDFQHNFIVQDDRAVVFNMLNSYLPDYNSVITIYRICSNSKK